MQSERIISSVHYVHIAELKKTFYYSVRRVQTTDYATGTWMPVAVKMWPVWYMCIQSVKTMVLMVVIYALCWLPLHSVTVIGDLRPYCNNNNYYYYNYYYNRSSATWDRPSGTSSTYSWSGSRATGWHWAAVVGIRSSTTGRTIICVPASSTRWVPGARAYVGPPLRLPRTVDRLSTSRRSGFTELASFASGRSWRRVRQQRWPACAGLRPDYTTELVGWTMIDQTT